jgi:hypothetical protein
VCLPGEGESRSILAAETSLFGGFRKAHLGSATVVESRCSHEEGQFRMPTVSIDSSTGCFLIGGTKVFPITLSNGPPRGSQAPGGQDAWAEVLKAGVTFLRFYTTWGAQPVAGQIATLIANLEAANSHGLAGWVGLDPVAYNGDQAVLEQIVNAVKDQPGLGAWKGADEPAWNSRPPAAVAAAHQTVRQLDPNHPLVLIQAPVHDTAQFLPATAPIVAPYTPGTDAHGFDIYPLPAGKHSPHNPNKTISIVGDMTAIIMQASPGKAIWMTLQAPAWSGTPSAPTPPADIPTLQEARFMAYDAIVHGARGLAFFGGDVARVLSGADEALGWNWTYWTNALLPLLTELRDPDHNEALTAPNAAFAVTANSTDIKLAVREAEGFVYLIAVRRNPVVTGPSEVQFKGLPTTITKGTVLGHGASNPARPFSVESGAFTDLAAFAPYNSRVYKFPVA